MRSAVSPDVPSSNRTSGAAGDLHAELLAACERLAHIWKERADTEAAKWESFNVALARTQDLEEALTAYSDFSWNRMEATCEDTRRLFEEYRSIIAQFATEPRSRPNSLLA